MPSRNIQSARTMGKIFTVVVLNLSLLTGLLVLSGCVSGGGTDLADARARMENMERINRGGVDF